MVAESAPRTSVAAEVAEKIRRMIDEGQMLPGERLPAERKLAGLFNVSRASVREGIKLLAESGRLLSRQGSGTYVRERCAENSGRTLVQTVLNGGYSLQDVIAVRLLLEPEIAALAARNGGAAVAARLEAVLAEQESAIGSKDYSGSADVLFHQILAEAAANPVLLEMAAALYEGFAKSREDGVQSFERQQASLKAHREIVAAVRAGDSRKAERAMHSHLTDVARRICSACR
ncbi:FadR/GntR family transcriptional regulator [Oleidesulfovibrio alaskensis]|jgi:GntR family transcriptional repressor for pyruvate dehydrogenase complex